MITGRIRIAWLWIGSSAIGFLVGAILAGTAFPLPPIDPGAMEGIKNQYDWREAASALTVAVPFAVSQWLVLRYVLVAKSGLWIAVTSIGLGVTIFLRPFGMPMLFLPMIIEPMIPGIVLLALGQWLVLYWLIKARFTWALLTVVGAVIGTYLAEIASVFAGVVGWGLMFGGCIGIFQAASLSKLSGIAERTRNNRGETIASLVLALVVLVAVAPSLLMERDSRYINSIAYSPDGSRIAADVENDLYVWDAETGKLIFGISTLQGPYSSWGPSRDLTFSPDGQRIAAGSRGLGAIVFDSVTGERLLVIEPKLHWHVEDIAFSPDGMRVALLVEGPDVAMYDAVDGQILTEFTSTVKRDIETPSVRTVAFSPDNRKVAAGGRYSPRRGPFEGFAAVWDVVTQKELLLLTGHDNVVWMVAFGPDNTRILTQSPESVRVWDASDGTAIATLAVSCGSITDAIFLREGDRIMTACVNGAVHLCETANGECTPTRIPQVYGLEMIDVHPDGNRVVKASLDGSVETWNAETGKRIRKFKMPAGD